MLSVIPDVHADPQRLLDSLALINRGSQIAFLGDLIDSGKNVRHPSDRAVLSMVRELVDNGRAVAIMGNHELNAILFHRSGPMGALRERNAKNIKQHWSFVADFGIGTPVAFEWTNWFLETLPLWREIRGLRLVHAYWSDRLIKTVAARRPDGYLHEDDLPEIAQGDSEFARAVKLLVSGPEYPLPADAKIIDNSGHRRSDIRLAWWKSPPATWKEAALSVANPAEIPDGPVPSEYLHGIEAGTSPIVFGHYKIEGEPRLLDATAACLDFPAQPCFLRWEGGQKIEEAQIVPV